MGIFAYKDEEYIDIDEIGRNSSELGDPHRLDSFGDDYGDWRYGIIPDVSMSIPGSHIRSVALLMHAEKGIFCFYDKNNDGEIYGCALEDLDDIVSIKYDKALKSATNIFTPGGDASLVVKEMMDDIESALNFIKDKSLIPIIPVEEPGKDSIYSVYAFAYEAGVNIEEELEKSNARYNQYYERISQNAQVTKTTSVTANTPPIPHQTTPSISLASTEVSGNRLDDKQYREMVKSRNLQINRTIARKNLSIEHDKTNLVESYVASAITNAQSVTFKGSPGTGKTQGVSAVCDKNDIEVFVSAFDDQTDGADISGNADIRTNAMTGNQEVGWREGLIIRAAKYAANAAKAYNTTVCFLDEVSRGMSHGKVIEYMSINSEKGEYKMQYDKPMSIYRIQSENNGPVWLELTDDVDKNRQRYSIRENGLSINSQSDFFEYNGDYHHALERANRGDLLSITRKDFYIMRDKFFNKILESNEGSKCIYVPKKALVFIGATNVNTHAHDQVNSLPSAYLSRAPIKEITAPNIADVVKSSIDVALREKGRLEGESVGWTPDDAANIRTLLTFFFSELKQVFDGHNRALGEEITYRIVAATLEAIPLKDPMAKKGKAIYDVLENEIITRFAVETAETPIGAQAENLNVVDAKNMIKSMKQKGMEGILAKNKAQERIQKNTSIPMDAGESPTASSRRVR